MTAPLQERRLRRPPFDPAALDPNVFEVDADAVRANVAALRALVGSDCALYAALKCNAYGFGLVETARTLVDAGVDAVPVARVRDAIELRDAGLTMPVLLYAGAEVTPTLVDAAAWYVLTPTLLDIAAAELFSSRLSEELPVFVKVDVGQHRLGVEPRRLASFAAAVASLPRLRLDGIYTHFSVPRDPVPASHLEKQFALFEACLGEADAAGLSPRVRMAASSSVLRLTSRMTLNAIDPGRIFFGVIPPGPATDGLPFRSVIRSLRSRLLQVKTLDDDGRRPDPLVAVTPGMRLGVFALGTGDGLATACGGEVLVRGRRARIVEPISLEHCRIDLSGVPDARARDEVVVIGRQGDEEITIAEVVAHRHLQLNAHEIAIGIRESVKRQYVS
jgi:alanine racemase